MIKNMPSYSTVYSVKTSMTKLVSHLLYKEINNSGHDHRSLEWEARGSIHSPLDSATILQ